MIDGCNGTTLMVQKVCLGPHAEGVIDRVMNVAGTDGAFDGVFPFPVGRSYNLSTLDATATHQAERGVAPMVASEGSLAQGRATVAAVVHPRRTAELTAENDEHFFIQAALDQISKQPTDRLINARQSALHAALEIPVMVPSSEVTGDECGTRLDQPTC